MRFVWFIFMGLLAVMVVVLPRLGQRVAPPGPIGSGLPVRNTTSLLPTPSRPPTLRADSIVAFGLAQKGTPYVYAGTSPLIGFDCSGFIMYTFAHYGVAVPHSTALLIDVGRPVARAEAQPGDIVVFTGTAPTSTTPGHAGIVISRRGEVPMRFVHASSSRREPFVKVNQVENSDYERRFMQVRRVLGPSAPVTTRPKVPVPASMDAPVTPLPSRSITLAPAARPANLPIKLAPKKTTRKTATTKPARRKASSATPKKPILKGKATYRPARTSTKKRTSH